MPCYQGPLRVLEEGKTHTDNLWTVQPSAGDVCVPTGRGAPQTLPTGPQGPLTFLHPALLGKRPSMYPRAVILPKAKALSSQNH